MTELTFPTDTPWGLRANLADLLERHLLGPAGGQTEVLNTAPDTVYLIGRIAPRRITDRDGDPATDADDGEVGSRAEANTSTGVPLSGVNDDGDADDDAADDQPQRRGLMIPASMGLRFQLPTDLATFTVRASWGTYRSRNHETETLPDGRPRRVFERTPHEVAARVDLADLIDGQTHEITLLDNVMLRIDAATDHHSGGENRRLVEVALCNDEETPSRIPVHKWLFQTRLYVETDGAAAFLPVHDVLTDTRRDPDDEVNRLAIQYRDRLEYAIGRTCSVDWQAAPGARRATKVWTSWLPTVETPQTLARDDAAVLTDMRALATASVDELRAGLAPIHQGYDAWLHDRDDEAAALPDHLRGDADEAISDARLVSAQLRAGVEFLLGDAEAQRCFAFMNTVMAEQRVRSEVVRLRSQDPTLTAEAALATVAAQGTKAHSWRLFQLAFVLMQLPALCDPAAKRRSGAVAEVELLFFPTGGGKTEAYLGLAAFAFAIRRRQGVIDTPDGPLDGRSGLAVLMRYTLRLLTAQQFQRATTMVCAAELERAKAPEVWGSEPFRIGLWVGTQVSPKRVAEAEEQKAKANDGYAHGLTVLQVRRCPWCGTPIDHRHVSIDRTVERVFVHCGDDFDCPFGRGGSVAGGLPVLTTDEEIYRLAPAFLIATVDKFARLAREGQAASLFGYVTERCERHGYVHPDDVGCTIGVNAKHQAKGRHAAAMRRTSLRLRPPDLVIQDELHLITGALGTTVGLFELAIDAATTWRTASGAPAKPLIVASSATVRRAGDLVRSLYGRGLTIFPTQVLDVADTYFSSEVAPTPETPGRRYVGVSTSGVRMTNAEIRVAELLLASGQLLLDRAGEAADPYLTLICYFNAIRELAGMKRYLGDDVQTALQKGRPWWTLPRRTGNLRIDELTSRASSSDITDTLDQLTVPFSVEFDSSANKQARAAARDHGETVPQRAQWPYDVVLATSMLQVGVDVQRLGLMLLVGQPKNTAEYIQASSRVGRSAAGPGLVVTLGNWARPRDLSHYETFRHYHETFYAQVEALSVTPYSPTSIERGLDGVLVAAARVLDGVALAGLSPERAAGRVTSRRPMLDALVDALVARAERADPGEGAAVRNRLLALVGQWELRLDYAAGRQQTLVYEKAKDAVDTALLISAEKARNDLVGDAPPPFVVPNSMREVQPEINLLVSPMADRLFIAEPVTAPRWVAPAPKGA